MSSNIHTTALKLSLNSKFDPRINPKLCKLLLSKDYRKGVVDVNGLGPLLDEIIIGLKIKTAGTSAGADVGAALLVEQTKQDKILFWSKSQKTAPGQGVANKTERVSNPKLYDTSILGPSGKYPDWRQKLSNFGVANIAMDSYHFRTLEHVWQFDKINSVDSKKAFHFTLESKSDLSKGDGLTAQKQRKMVKLTSDQIHTWETKWLKGFPDKGIEPKFKTVLRIKFTDNSDCKQVLLATLGAQLWHQVQRKAAIRWPWLEEIRDELRLTRLDAAVPPRKTMEIIQAPTGFDYYIVRHLMSLKDIEETVMNPKQDVASSSAEWPSVRRSSRPRSAIQVWRGVETIHEFIRAKQLVPRSTGRYDYEFPKAHPIAKLVRQNLYPIVSLLESRVLSPSKPLDLVINNNNDNDIDKDAFLKKWLDSVHFMAVLPGAVNQSWHSDHDSGKYLTVIFALTGYDLETGGTEFVQDVENDKKEKKETKETNVPKLNIGDGLIFDGLQMHRGMANTSKSKERYFLYAVITRELDKNKA